MKKLLAAFALLVLLVGAVALSNPTMQDTLQDHRVWRNATVAAKGTDALRDCERSKPPPHRQLLAMVMQDIADPCTTDRVPIMLGSSRDPKVEAGIVALLDRFEPSPQARLRLLTALLYGSAEAPSRVVAVLSEPDLPPKMRRQMWESLHTKDPDAAHRVPPLHGVGVDQLMHQLVGGQNNAHLMAPGLLPHVARLEANLEPLLNQVIRDYGISIDEVASQRARLTGGLLLKNVPTWWVDALHETPHDVCIPTSRPSCWRLLGTLMQWEHDGQVDTEATLLAWHSVRLAPWIHAGPEPAARALAATVVPSANIPSLRWEQGAVGEPLYSLLYGANTPGATAAAIRAMADVASLSLAVSLRGDGHLDVTQSKTDETAKVTVPCPNPQFTGSVEDLAQWEATIAGQWRHEAPAKQNTWCQTFNTQVKALASTPPPAAPPSPRQQGL